MDWDFVDDLVAREIRSAPTREHHDARAELFEPPRDETSLGLPATDDRVIRLRQQAHVQGVSGSTWSLESGAWSLIHFTVPPARIWTRTPRYRESPDPGSTSRGTKPSLVRIDSKEANPIVWTPAARIATMTG